MSEQSCGREVTYYVIDLGRREPVPCKCGNVSFFCASLIPQRWIQDSSHIPATNCNCGQYYYSFAKGQVFECRS